MTHRAKENPARDRIRPALCSSQPTRAVGLALREWRWAHSLPEASGSWRTRVARSGDAAMARRLVYADLRTIDRALTDAESNFRRSEERPPDPEDAGQQWPFGWGTRGMVTIVGRLPRDPRGEPRRRRVRALATAFGLVEQLQNSLAAGRRPFQDADATSYRTCGVRSTAHCARCRPGRRAPDRERSRETGLEPATPGFGDRDTALKTPATTGFLSAVGLAMGLD